MAIRTTNDTVMESLLDLKAMFMQSKKFHSDVKNLWDMLNVRGEKRVAEYKMFRKLCEISKLERFAINYLGVIIPDVDVDKIEIIPRTMYSMDRNTVDENMIKANFKNVYNAWEKLMEDSHMLLVDLWYKNVNEKNTKLATYIKCLLDKNECGMKKLQRCHMDLKSINYDVGLIMMKQDDLHDHMKSLMHKVAEID